ncbi:MAG: DUF3429 domain-containing protein [Pseudomonadota bacterium]
MSWFSIRNIPPAALQLGMAGAMPFAFLAILVFVAEFAALLLLYYASIIMAFMGGIHWGVAMGQNANTFSRFGISVVPAIVGTTTLIVGGYIGFLMLATAFCLLLAYDLFAVRQGNAPTWYPNLRIPLTLIVVVSLLLAASSLEYPTSFAN